MHMSTNERKATKETSYRWYIRQQKKEKEEVQNTLTLKSGREKVST